MSCHSCGCYFETYHLPKDFYRSHTPLHGNGLFKQDNAPCHTSNKQREREGESCCILHFYSHFCPEGLLHQTNHNVVLLFRFFQGEVCNIRNYSPHSILRLELLKRTHTVLSQTHAIGWVNAVMSGLVRQVLARVMILGHHQKCLNGHVSIRAGPWSNGRRLPGLINHIFFYIRCLAGCVFNWGRGSRKSELWEKGRPGEAESCSAALGPGIHVGVTLASTTYLKIVTGCVHPFMAVVLPDDSGLL